MKNNMIRRCVALVAVVMLAAGGAWAWAQQEPGPAERAGERLDEAGREAGRQLDKAGRRIRRGLEKGIEGARGAVREQFAQTRDRVHEMSVEARVYGRLHWDKLLVDSDLDLSAEARGIVTLRGTVPSNEARQRAVRLTTDTVGVSRVIDQLNVQATPKANSKPKVKVKTTTPAPDPAPAPVDEPAPRPE